MTERKPKILLVVFSRTGTTKRLAEAIAQAEGGEIEELREARSRRGLLGWLRSGYEGTYGRSAKTLPLAHDLRDYDLVFVGSPTWNQSLSSPVRGFLETHGAELKNVAIFATCGGHGGETVLDQMTTLLSEAPLARLSLREADVKNAVAPASSDFAKAAIAAWEARIGKLRVAS